MTPAPQSKLKLEWVYGYRGRDARANLHLLPTGENKIISNDLFNKIVFKPLLQGEMTYFVAAVVVLYNVEDQSQRHYLGT